MEKCIYCTADTPLRENGFPICVECIGRLRAGVQLTRKRRISYAAIAKILDQEVYSAEARLKAAREDVDALISETPSLPQPDGSLRISIAIRERIMASEALERAAKRNADFDMNQIIPEDLK